MLPQVSFFIGKKEPEWMHQRRLMCKVFALTFEGKLLPQWIITKKNVISIPAHYKNLHLDNSIQSKRN